MNCPICDSQTNVIDSRKSEGKIRRRKQCKRCLVKFTTYEIMDQDYEDIVKQKHRLLEQVKTRSEFTRKEDELLLKLKSDGLTRADIALEMGRTKGSIKWRMQVMGAKV